MVADEDHLDASDDGASEDEDAYANASVDDADGARDVVVPFRSRRPSLVQNAYAAVDDPVVDPREDPCWTFSHSAVVGDDEDEVAWDRTMVAVALWMNASDHLDEVTSYRMGRIHDVKVSFYTCVDVPVVVVHRHRDEDCS